MKTDELIDQACRQTGLGPFEDASYHEGLQVLVKETNRCDVATEQSKEVMGKWIVAALVNRFRIEDYLLKHPEVLDTPIEKPVFVFGIPRTGTTMTNHLLGADPARRSLLNWEATDTIPPSSTATLFSDPRCIEQKKQQEELLAQNPDMVLPHWEWADDPTECNSILTHDFKALSWDARLPMPGYTEWLLNCDMTPAYEYHKKVLQILQSKAPGIWNLKMPSHALFLETVTKVYPDARLIWTHRDPYKTFASSCSLYQLSYNATRATGVDPTAIGESLQQLLWAHLQGALMAKDKLGDDGIYDIQYADLMQDPIAEMRKLYEWLGDPFSASVEQFMRTWLDEHPKNKFGKHTYSLEGFGLSADKLKRLFGEYVVRFNIKTA